MNASESPTLTIGNRKQLFLDDYVIERSEDLRRVVNQFEKHPANPVLKSELPWEQQRIGEYVLLYDEEQKLFKCWYPGCAVFYDREVTAEDQALGYAESEDGVHWQKRQIAPDACTGGNQNRHLLLRDPRETDPAKRYKALARGPEGYYHTCYSPDGLEWSEPVERTTMKYVDDPPYLHYDEQMESFVFYRRFWTRSHEVVGGGHQWGWPGDRAVGLAASRDFVYWQPNNTLLLRADEQDQRWAQEQGGERADIHAMSGFPYEGLWLGFVERENLIQAAAFDKKTGRFVGNDDSARLPSLAYSRDGYRWERLADRTAPIPWGAPGEWDAADLGYPTSRPIVRGNEIWVFYRGGDCTKRCTSWYGDVEAFEQTLREAGGEEYCQDWKARHDHPWDAKTMSIGLATLRRDGFVSLEPESGTGTLLTRPLVFEGSHLSVNAQAADGSVAVEVQDAAGRALEGYALADCRALASDAVEQRVSWSGGADLGALAGRAVRLRFALSGAKLFAFGFRA